jgi:hypothetical protein
MTDGKKYLDCVSGIATCALGHNNPALTKAICDQMATVHHVSNLYYIPEQAALANWLCANSAADKAFFCNSGAESNEAAIKCARRHASNRGITVRFQNLEERINNSLRKIIIFNGSETDDVKQLHHAKFLTFFLLLPETRHYYCRAIFPRPHPGGLDCYRPTQISQGLRI